MPLNFSGIKVVTKRLIKISANLYLGFGRNPFSGSFRRHKHGRMTKFELILYKVWKAIPKERGSNDRLLRA
jgi:hypothetical protein